VASRFIIHGPGAPNELQTALFDQLLDLILKFGSLFFPPFEEERRFDVDELLLGIGQQFMDDRIEDVLNAGLLDEGFTWVTT
jgi:hypothetical protein